MKRFFLGILATMVLITAVGCGAKPTDGELAGEEVQSEIEEKSAELGEEKKELTENDLVAILFFQTIVDNLDSVIASADANQDNRRFLMDEVDPYYNMALNFVFSDEICDGVTIYDLSPQGKIKVFELVREIEKGLYPVTSVAAKGDASVKREWLEAAEELHEVYGTEERANGIRQFLEKGEHSVYFDFFYEYIIVQDTETPFEEPN